MTKGPLHLKSMAMMMMMMMMAMMMMMIRYGSANEVKRRLISILYYLFIYLFIYFK